MRILGIESSCDETAAAVVEETMNAAKPWVVRSSVVASQVEIHREWGGIVPELASRQHVRDICGVVERAMAESQTGPSDLGAIVEERVEHAFGAIGFRRHEGGIRLAPRGLEAHELTQIGRASCRERV